MPPRDYVPPEPMLPDSYYQLLRAGLPTKAFAELNAGMEGVLLQAGHFGACNEGRRDGRGRVLLTDQPQAAGCVREQAATVRTRAIARGSRFRKQVSVTVPASQLSQLDHGPPQ